jgi:hypothetical protein
MPAAVSFRTDERAMTTRRERRPHRRETGGTFIRRAVPAVSNALGERAGAATCLRTGFGGAAGDETGRRR